MDYCPSVSFIGAGNVAWHFASRLHGSGCRIVQVWSRHAESARLLAQHVGADAVADLASVSAAGVDVFIVAVGDDAIDEVVRQVDFGNALVVHTAGSVNIDVLQGASDRYGVLWPVQSLVKGQECGDIPCAVEGSDDAATDDVERLARCISSQVYRLDSRQRCRAHLAATMVSNFGNAINALAEEYLQQGNIDFAMLRPLIESAVHKAAGGNLWKKQTGPAARHDITTIERQRALLKHSPELLQLYDLMTAIIENRC